MCLKEFKRLFFIFKSFFNSDFENIPNVSINLQIEYLFVVHGTFKSLEQNHIKALMNSLERN